MAKLVIPPAKSTVSPNAIPAAPIGANGVANKGVEASDKEEPAKATLSACN